MFKIKTISFVFNIVFLLAIFCTPQASANQVVYHNPPLYFNFPGASISVSNNTTHVYPHYLSFGFGYGYGGYAGYGTNYGYYGSYQTSAPYVAPLVVSPNYQQSLINLAEGKRQRWENLQEQLKSIIPSTPAPAAPKLETTPPASPEIEVQKEDEVSAMLRISPPDHQLSEERP